MALLRQFTPIINRRRERQRRKDEGGGMKEETGWERMEGKCVKAGKGNGRDEL
jgi:hypothetical protein